jgi:hypothetical protein
MSCTITLFFCYQTFLSVRETSMSHEKYSITFTFIDPPTRSRPGTDPEPTRSRLGTDPGAHPGPTRSRHGTHPEPTRDQLYY